MPIFVAWLGQAFALLFTAFTKDAARRIAAIATVTVVIAGMFIALLAVVDAILGGIAVAMPSILSTVCTWVVPNNFQACLTARLTAEIAIAIYKWKRDIAMAGATA